MEKFSWNLMMNVQFSSKKSYIWKESSRPLWTYAKLERETMLQDKINMPKSSEKVNWLREENKLTSRKKIFLDRSFFLTFKSSYLKISRASPSQTSESSLKTHLYSLFHLIKLNWTLFREKLFFFLRDFALISKNFQSFEKIDNFLSDRHKHQPACVRTNVLLVWSVSINALWKSVSVVMMHRSEERKIDTLERDFSGV